jgi:hypothetical protein
MLIRVGLEIRLVAQLIKVATRLKQKLIGAKLLIRQTCLDKRRGVGSIGNLEGEISLNEEEGEHEKQKNRNEF